MMNLTQKESSGKLATGILQKAALAALGVIAVLMTGNTAIAQSAKTQKTFQKDYIVSAIYNYGARSIEITASTGCVSSSLRGLGNNIQFSVDEERALITGTGKFTYKSSKSRIVKTDCAGRSQKKVELPNVEQRRYTVIVNGRYRGVLDFTQSAKPPRLTLRRAVNRSGLLSKMQLINTYASVNLDSWASRNAASVMDLFRPIIDSHPESLDGRPEMEISMRRNSAGNSLTVRITNLGYLDDSVSGEKYTGMVTRTANGWHLKSLWKQSLCARGPKAGQWIKGNCL